MGIVIYRKSDNRVEMEVLQFPLHDTGIFEKFIANGGHKAIEFGTIEITEDEMPLAMQKQIIIVDGKITFGEDRPTPPTQTPSTPSVEEQLAERDKEIIELKKMQNVTGTVISEMSTTLQELIEFSMGMGNS